MMRGASELEMHFNSVERQQYYTEVKSEKDFTEPSKTRLIEDNTVKFACKVASAKEVILEPKIYSRGY